MKAHAYAVRQDGSRSLPALVESILALPLEQRSFGAAGGGIRLEAVQTEGRILFLNFARARSGHGPGQLGLNIPMQDIDLAEGRTFGEDSAMAYETNTGYAAVQFNPFGPRPTAICDYLTAADYSLGPPAGPDGQYGYTFGMKFRSEAYRRARQFQLVKEITFTIGEAGLHRGDFQAGRSVASVLAAPRPEGTRQVTVTLSAGRGRGDSLALDAALALLADLEQLGSDLVGGTIKGKRELLGRTEPIDLVDERLRFEQDIRPGRGHRLGLPERWRCLRAALQRWRADNELQ